LLEGFALRRAEGTASAPVTVAEAAPDVVLRHYRDLFEFAPQAYLVTDEGGKIQEANAEAARMLNLPEGFMVGKSLLAYIPLNERQAFREAVKQRIDPDMPRQWISAVQPRGRARVEVSVSAVSIFDNEWRLVGASWILQDISPLKHAETELRESRDELEMRVQQRTADLEASNRQKDELVGQLRLANEAKDEFLGLLSHELRTSMTLIYVGVKAVLRTAGSTIDTEQLELLESVEQETDAMYRMIEDLLNLARLELGEQLTTEPVLMQHVIRRFARNFTHTRPKRELRIDVSEDLQPVLAEPTYVEQVLRNLVSNVEKYSPPESPVELRATNNGGNEVVVSVLDRGPGIPEDEREAVFERFYRSQNLPRQVRGMGMGLTVCKRLIEAQRGRIWLASREGGGLEASFTLPVARVTDAA
jgi:PAS domain S-box-containing protein